MSGNHSNEWRLPLESELVDALRAGQLTMAYQPMFDIVDGRLVGLEALSRWTHSTLGAVPPAEFVAVAERSGLIFRFTRWSLQQACEELAAWRWESPGAAGIPVSVNISTECLLEPGFADIVEECTTSSGLAPSDIVVEVAAHTVGRGQVIENLRGLAERRIPITLDGFDRSSGTAEQLGRMPLSSVKIGVDVLRAAGSDPEAAELIRSVATVGARQGFTTVAKGVETRDELEAARSAGCSQAQGNLLGQAIPESRFADLLHAGWAI